MDARGHSFGRPEVVLLFKGKARKDDDDLAALLPSLPHERCRWLADAVALAYGADHPWLSPLGAR